MLLKYIDEAMKNAKYEILDDDKSFYSEIEGFSGVMANASNLEDCRKELQEVLEEWILIRIYKNLDLPSVNGISINIAEVA